MTILEATKIEGYLQLEPCRDLAQAKPGQLAIEGNVGREYRETIVEIDKVYKTGQVRIVGGYLYWAKWNGAKDFRRAGKNPGGERYSLRPFAAGETVESFLAAQNAKRQAKEEEAEAVANAKEAEHMRRLALLGGASLWDNREEEVYCNPGSEDKLWIVVLIWNDARGRLHVTHCYIPAPVEDWNGKRQYLIKIWDVDANNTGASSAQGEDPRDAIERWITQNWA